MEYRVNVGMNYPPERRAEPGDVVSDIPESSIPWLLECGAISDPAAPAPAPAPAPAVESVTVPEPVTAPEAVN